MMSKNAKRKILTAAVLCACTTLWASPVWAIDYVGTGNVQIANTDEYDNVYGNYADTGNSLSGQVIMTGGKVNGIIMGSYLYKNGTDDNSVVNSKVEISGGEVVSDITGGYLWGNGKVSENKVIISGGEIKGLVIGGNANGNDVYVTDNEVSISGGVIYYNISGGDSLGNVKNNKVIISGGAEILGDNVFGGYGENAARNEIKIIGGKIQSNLYGADCEEEANENIINIYGGEISNKDGIYSISGARANIANNNAVFIYGGNINSETYKIFGGDAVQSAVNNKVVLDSNSKITVKIISAGNSTLGEIKNNYVEVSNGIVNANYITGGDGADVQDNVVKIFNGTINSRIFGGYGDDKALNNKVYLYGGTITEAVYGGGIDPASSSKEVNNNSIYLYAGANIEQSSLYGSNKTNKDTNGNTLVINGWSGNTKSVENFNEINFSNVKWQDGKTVLNITDTHENVLDNVEVNIDNLTLATGTSVQSGDKMTFIQSNLNTGLALENVNKNEDVSFNQGVAKVGSLKMKLEGETNNLIGEITGVSLNDQTKLVAKNHAVAAAFINQGTDLIADSLDTLSRDGKYGIKTFAAVHGNRSKYDVNSDIKINGWSTIVGVGSENEHNGGDFSWGVFYENGSGNYRTYNEFNNEFFRGDGSLVYNGGGVAARYENAHGVYTEGSLRAGMLKSEMTDALSDGNQKYGYKSESEYYGAHIGIGQIIPLSESSDLDVYGKFFHTYTEGDSFNVAGDEFEFDSINSDRLRVGARLTTNKENKFSTYYGLAYEYEFNGDAEMRAAGMDAPTQSLQGSSYMAEIGLNYQPTPDSPWSFELNMRGYAGEREGATFNVQATYTF